MTDKKQILVVEDDHDGRNALVAMLEAMGYGVHAFPEGESALQFLRGSPDQQINLALLDIMLPGKNGYEVMQDFKEMPRFSSVPVIMVTAKDADAEIIEGYKFGADYYITKPFTLKQLQYGISLYL